MENKIKLRAWRKHRRLSQEALAASAKCRRATVSDIERGRVEPKDDTLRQLARALRARGVRCLYGNPVTSR